MKKAIDRPQSRTWLWVLGATAGLALVAEGAALIATMQANKRYTDEPAFGAYRNLAITFHVTAGVSAIAGIVSWILHVKGRRPKKDTIAILPTPDGMVMVGRF